MKAGVFLRLRLFESLEDFIPDSDCIRHGFQSGRKFFKLTVSKVAVAYTGCQNEVIIGQRYPFSIGSVYKYAPPLLVHTPRLSQEHCGVSLVLQNSADRRGNLAGCQDGDGHLIEQWLKQMVVGAVEQRYVRP